MITICNRVRFLFVIHHSSLHDSYGTIIATNSKVSSFVTSQETPLSPVDTSDNARTTNFVKKHKGSCFNNGAAVI
jgi:hypothetical protein